MFLIYVVFHGKLAELEPALCALESKKKIKRMDFDEKGKTNQMITLI